MVEYFLDMEKTKVRFFQDAPIDFYRFTCYAIKNYSVPMKLSHIPDTLKLARQNVEKQTALESTSSFYQSFNAYFSNPLKDNKNDITQFLMKKIKSEDSEIILDRKNKLKV